MLRLKSVWTNFEVMIIIYYYYFWKFSRQIGRYLTKSNYFSTWLTQGIVGKETIRKEINNNNKYNIFFVFSGQCSKYLIFVSICWFYFSYQRFKCFIDLNCSNSGARVTLMFVLPLQKQFHSLFDLIFAHFSFVWNFLDDIILILFSKSQFVGVSLRTVMRIGTWFFQTLNWWLNNFWKCGNQQFIFYF